MENPFAYQILARIGRKPTAYLLLVYAADGHVLEAYESQGWGSVSKVIATRGLVQLMEIETTPIFYDMTRATCADAGYLQNLD